MKKTLGLFLVLFVGIQQLVYAQTGIGTNSPNDQAVLEIQSVDKGVLFPSISLTSTTTFLGGISATSFPHEYAGLQHQHGNDYNRS